MPKISQFRSVGEMTKTTLKMVAALGFAGFAFADTVASTAGTAFTNFPTITGTGSTATFAGYPGSPFWDNSTTDAALGSGSKGNVGFFLQNLGDFTTGTNFLGGAGVYRSDSTTPANAPTSFSFLQGASTVSVTLLFASAGNNFGAFGTTIFLYDTSNPATRQVLWSSGQLWASSGGMVNNSNLGTTSFANSVGGTTNTTVSANNFASWGIGATTCTNSIAGTGCNTFFSNSGLNTGGETAHAHFALFAANAGASTYYAGFEDVLGTSGTEGVGDFNDVIFRITTNAAAAVPEPTTVAFVGLGLVGIGMLRRRLQK